MAESSGIQVLHVDDEPDLAELAADMLECEDSRFSVETAASGSNGLDRLTAGDFDCIISDYQMPGQNGIEFLETVREEYPNLPFILYTGKGSEEVASDALSAGATDYLQKDSGSEQYELLANRIESAVVQSRAEQQAATTQRRLRELSETTDDILWTVTADWSEFLFVNSAYEDVWSRSRDVLLENPMDFLQGVHPADRDLVTKKMQRASNGESVDFEFRVNADEDFQRRVWVQAEPIHDETGDPVRIGGFVRDITERTERERTLTQMEYIVQNMNDGAVIIQDGVIKYANPRLSELVGYAEDELVETPMGKFLAPSHRETVEKRHHARIAGEGADLPDQYELELLSDDGQQIPVEVNTSVIEYQGEPATLSIVRDITERTHQEERFQAFIESSTDIISVLDSNGTYQYQSPSSKHVVGYEPDELIDETAFEYIHPEDRDDVIETFSEAVTNPEMTASVEYRFKHKDGTWLWLKSVGNNQLGNPAIEGFVVNSRDITKRKRHEQQLQALHGANRHLIDADSRADVANIAVKAASDLLEFSVPSMWYTTNGEIELVANTEDHQRLLAESGTQNPTHSPDSWVGDIIESGETTVKSPLPPDDLAADVPLHSAILLPFGEEGVLSCAVKGKVEFTDRQVRIGEILAHNVEAALDQLDQRMVLERQQQFTDDLLDALEDVVYVLDSTGDLIKWNRALEEVTDYDSDQIDSMNATGFFSDDDKEAIAVALAESFETGRTRIEVDILTADGESIPYEFVAKSFENPDGEPVIAGIGRDRSLHVEYERTLEEQRNNLEILNQVVRHDIRNDMNVVQGRAELLEDHIDEAGQEHLESVLGATKSAIELTTTGRNLAETMLSSEEDVEPVRLDNHLRDPIEHARGEFQDAVITLKKIPDVRVYGNDLLEAVFRNLIQNAVVHNDKQTPTVQISTTVGTETSRVVVADDGPGIPDDQKETIFGKGETGLESPGTGIGLSLVQTLVEQYGGEVWVEDNDPEGSVFVVELPVADNT